MNPEYDAVGLDDKFRSLISAEVKHICFYQSYTPADCSMNMHAEEQTKQWWSDYAGDSTSLLEPKVHMKLTLQFVC